MIAGICCKKDDTYSPLISENQTAHKKKPAWYNLQAHPYDYCTPQPASLSLNKRRNCSRIIHHSLIETSAKYFTITSIFWLIWHCRETLTECEHSTVFEYFVLTQAIVSSVVYIISQAASYDRLKHEEKSILLGMAINNTKKKIIFSKCNQQSQDEHIKKLKQLIVQFSTTHPKQAALKISQFFSCHRWTDFLNRVSMLFAYILDSMATLYMSKIAITIVNNAINDESMDAQNIGLLTAIGIILCATIMGVLKSRKDLISDSAKATLDRINENLSEIILVTPQNHAHRTQILSLLQQRSDLYDLERIKNPEKAIRFIDTKTSQLTP